MNGPDVGSTHDGYTPKLVAVRTTLAATEADLRGSWEEVSFLTETVPLLPAPAEVAWAAVFLTVKNLELLRPPPDADDIAVAGASTALRPRVPAGAGEYAAIVLATVARSVTGRVPRSSLELLIASTGSLLTLDAPVARDASAGLFTAVTYSFVRSSVALGLDPLETVSVVRRSLPD